MKHIRLVLAIFLAASGLIFASGLDSAIGGLESASQSFLLISTLLLLGAGIALCLGGLAIYYRKVRGAYRPAPEWKAAAFAAGGIGIIALMAGLLGLMIYLLTPSLAKGLLQG